MVDALIGAATFFGLLVIKKAVLEPLATSVGQKLIDKHLPSVCKLLDESLMEYGFQFNAEEAVRDYLELSDDDIDEKQKQEIIDAVFREWDLRKVTINPQ